MLSGDLTSTSSKNTPFSKVCAQFYHGLSLLQEDADFLQETQTFYRKTQTFYRKLPVEVRDGPEFIL